MVHDNGQGVLPSVDGKRSSLRTRLGVGAALAALVLAPLLLGAVTLTTFSNGQVADAALVNANFTALAAQAAFPKMMNVNLVGAPGSATSTAAATVPVHSLDGDLFGVNAGDGVTLPPGRYHFEIDFKPYASDTVMLALHNATTNTEIKRTYGWSTTNGTSMPMSTLRASATFTTSTKVQFKRVSGGGTLYPALGTITMLGE